MMGDKTGIEWTEATWNPIVGCSIVSPGCTNCYAMKMAARIEAMAIGQTTKNGGAPGLAATHYAGTTKPSKAGPVWTGKLALAPEDVLLKPLRWKRPRMIFVNSMSDLFHESVPDEWITQTFAVMQIARRHTYQVLTKRTSRMHAWMHAPGRKEEIDAAIHALGLKLEIGGAIFAEHAIGRPVRFPWPAPHIWIGASAEDQKRYDERKNGLRATPAAVRFLSIEPLLGPIALDLEGLSQLYRPFHWIIVGGESGPGARPMHPDWARSIRDQCQPAGVPFFFKQWGTHAWAESVEGDASTLVSYRVGKRAAGRLLDGVEHNDMPEASR
jgi:protein gp37